MTAVSLDGYFLRVRQKNKNQALPLGAFDDGASVPTLVGAYLQLLQDQTFISADHMKSARVDRLEINGDFYSGILGIGAYGVQSDIINIETGDVSYKKQKPDADMIPYFFAFCMPPAASRGIVVLQRVGLLGIKTLLKEIAPSYCVDVDRRLTP